MSAQPENIGPLWSEKLIAGTMARQVFEHKHLVIVPNCSWPGSECDLLVVTPNLRVIDVEIKISRADLRADAKKDKWFHSWDWRVDGRYDRAKRKPRQWPRRVWKHYYALPRDIWDASLLDSLPSPTSGVLLMYEDKRNGDFRIRVERMAKPDRQAEKITPEDAIDIARLASLRMWDALVAGSAPLQIGKN
jgi:hypothetical protein